MLDILRIAIYNTVKLCILQTKGGGYMFYIGIGKERGNVIDEKYSFGYALEKILNNESEKIEFIEWYYSGNWIKISVGDDTYE